MPDQDVVAVTEWLKTCGSTLWGRSYNIQEDPSKAAVWFISQMESFIDSQPITENVN